METISNKYKRALNIMVCFLFTDYIYLTIAATIRVYGNSTTLKQYAVYEPLNQLALFSIQ